MKKRKIIAPELHPEMRKIIDDDNAGDGEFFYINYEIKELQKAFPENVYLHRVSRYYPFRKKEKYEDYPLLDIEIEYCKKKSKILNAKENLYVYYFRGKKYDVVDSD